MPQDIGFDDTAAYILNKGVPMKRRSPVILAILVLLIAVASACPAAWAAPATPPLSIAFTHDMHSHLDTITKTENNAKIRTGGFAKLSMLIQDVKATYPNTLLVDAGDFSMGTLYQTIYAQAAPELILLGALGYDATTLGNHEFDYRAAGLTGMLDAALSDGGSLPQILCANIDWDGTLADADLHDDALTLKQAMDDYGVTPYTMIEKDGYSIALFGLIGDEAISFSPMSGVIFSDPVKAAKDVVQSIEQNEQADIIICLSHSGTVDDLDASEDVLLARAVPDIDVIISGHSHTLFESPVIEGDTIIVSCGEYTEYLGHLVVVPREDGTLSIQSYTLLPLGADVPEDASIQIMVDSYRQRVTKDYLMDFGYQMGAVVANAPFPFTPFDQFGDMPGEDTLGNLIADSYIYAASQSDNETVSVTVVPAGVVRDSFKQGDITVDDVFKVSSLGIGPDAVPGYPLVSIYLTGKELWALCEVDASISTIMKDARLYMAGIRYTFNPHRLFLNRVTDVYLVDAEGVSTVPEDDKLYRVVGGLYSTQMLSTVKDKSFGLLSLVPKDKNGNPITNFEAQIIYKDNVEYKEWVALADYLGSFDKMNGISTVPQRYAAAEGRKVIEDSRNVAAILKRPNKIFFMLLGVVLFILLVIALAVYLIVRMIRKRRKKQAA